MVDADKLSVTIKENYDQPLSAELTIFHRRDGEIVAHKIEVNFWSDGDYQYSDSTKIMR